MPVSVESLSSIAGNCYRPRLVKHRIHPKKFRHPDFLLPRSLPGTTAVLPLAWLGLSVPAFNSVSACFTCARSASASRAQERKYADTVNPASAARRCNRAHSALFRRIVTLAERKLGFGAVPNFRPGAAFASAVVPAASISIAASALASLPESPMGIGARSARPTRSELRSAGR